MTCQPKADLTGGRICAVLEPRGEDRLLELRVDAARAVEERELAAGAGRTLGLALVALLAGDRVEQARVVLAAWRTSARAWAWAASQDGSRGRDARGARRVALRAVQDVADLDRVGAEARRLGLADVDLRDLALRRGARDVGDDLALELVVDDVRREDRAVLVEVDAVVDDLGLVGGVDRLGRDLGHPADPDRCRRHPRRPRSGVLAVGGEDGLQEGLVGLRVVAPAIQPRSPACGAVEASVETVLATSSQALPPVMSLSAASAFGLGGGVLGGGRARRRRGRSTGLTSMTQAWRVSGVVASVTRRASMSSGVALTPSCVGELGLELGVDQPLERDRRELLAHLVVGLRLGRALGLGQVPGRDRGGGSGRSASSSRQASICSRSLSSSLLIDWPSTLPTDARWSL